MVELETKDATVVRGLDVETASMAHTPARKLENGLIFLSRASEAGRRALAVARTATLPASLVLIWLLAAAGFIVTCIGAAQASAGFSTIGRTVQLSSSIQHTIRLYDGCRYAVLIAGLVALLAFPAALLAAAAVKRATAGLGLQSFAGGGNSRRGMLASGAALAGSAVFCTLALVVAVVAIGVSVKAEDTVTAVKARVDSGSRLLGAASSMLAQLQAASDGPNAINGLLSGLLSSLTAGGGGQGDALSQLFAASDLTGFFRLLSPIQIGNLVRAIDPSPQSLLQLVAFITNRLPRAQSDGLVCPVGCLNQVDACICNTGQLSALSSLLAQATQHCKLTLIGACILAVGLGLLCSASQLGAAKYCFLRQLVFSDAYDRHLAAKHALLARGNSLHARSGSLRRASGGDAKELGAHGVAISVTPPMLP